MDISGVPDFVSRVKVNELLRLMGLNVNEINELHITPECVVTKIRAKGTNGEYFVVGSNLAFHEIIIPIVD